jgi:deoxyribonuclease-4
MPKVGLGGEDMVGFSPEQVKQLCGDRFRFCLDLNHAVKASSAMERPYESLIKEFMDLAPCVFHIADGFQEIHYDEHLAIGEGDYDMRTLLDSLSSIDTIRLTLETPRTSLEDDMINLRKVQSLIG